MLVDPIFDGDWIPRINWLVLVTQFTKAKIELGREHVLDKRVDYFLLRRKNSLSKITSRIESFTYQVNKTFEPFDHVV